MRTASLLDVLASNAASPSLTWYGTDGERVELSGRVLSNWVIKAANLLSNECAVGPDTQVGIDLPAHWRLLVWALGTWSLGAPMRLLAAAEPDGGALDLLITSRPQGWVGQTRAEIVAVPLPALARSWPSDLPDGAIDGAAELMGQPDVPTFAPAPAPATDGGVNPGRVLLLADDSDRAAVIAQAWACWAAGGSVVLATSRADADLERIEAQEGARRA